MLWLFSSGCISLMHRTGDSFLGRFLENRNESQLRMIISLSMRCYIGRILIQPSLAILCHAWRGKDEAHVNFWSRKSDPSQSSLFLLGKITFTSSILWKHSYVDICVRKARLCMRSRGCSFHQNEDRSLHRIKKIISISNAHSDIPTLTLTWWSMLLIISVTCQLAPVRHTRPKERLPR